MKQIWKNANFTKRDYDCTNIVAAMGNKPVNGNWIEGNSSDLSKLTMLYIQDGTEYYGYL